MLKASIVLPNEEMKLKPGMSVVVRLRDQPRRKQCRCLRKRLFLIIDAYFVVIRKGNEFTVREVVVAGSHGGTTYFTSGVEPGEEIVAKNQLLIYNELKSK